VPKQQDTEWATIGNVVALFGVQGELKVLLLTDIPNRFNQLDVVYVGPNHIPHRIERVRPYKGEMVVLKLQGIDDANTAEKMRNFGLTIPESQLAQLPPDSYYQHDILGLQVFTLKEHAVGPIVDIIVTGSNDVYVINSPDGKQKLIPAIKDVVKQVDLRRKVMYIDPIAGLLDDDAVLDGDEEEDTGSVDATDQ
jgi:16S rRNA processing protein RimM